LSEPALLDFTPRVIHGSLETHPIGRRAFSILSSAEGPCGRGSCQRHLSPGLKADDTAARLLWSERAQNVVVHQALDDAG